MKPIVNLGLSFVIIAAFVFAIYEKQEIINDGEVIYLKLAPVDPRSLMQGDYMRLRYAIETSRIEPADIEKRSYLKLGLDDNNVAHLSKYFKENELTPAQYIGFKYSNRNTRAKIEPGSFLFQQGLRAQYEAAKYGIFRIKDGQHLLVGLADSELKQINPPH